MRTITKITLISCVVAGGVFAYSKGYWLRSLHKKTIKTEQPVRKNIVRKKVFSGSLIPHKEVALETHITGVVEKLFVHVGDYVQQGTAIARIKVQPDIKEVELAESRLRISSIYLNKSRVQYLRDKQLFGKKMMAKASYESSVAAWEEAKERYAAAEKKMQIIKYGYTKGKGIGANIIKATIKGTILNLPAEEGSMVNVCAQSNRAVVAVIGDMDHYLFSAKVSELDVVHLVKGMSFEISLNAFKDEKFQVTLTKIAPKARQAEAIKGEVKFEIEGIVTKPKKQKNILRAGYTAVAEVVIEQVSDVLAVPEKIIQAEGKTYFVNCLYKGEKVKKYVVLGLSDGLYVEVNEGLTENDLLIVEE